MKYILITASSMIIGASGVAMMPEIGQKIVKYGALIASPIIAGQAWHMVVEPENLGGWHKGLLWGLYAVRNPLAGGFLMADLFENPLCVCCDSESGHSDANDKAFRRGIFASIIASYIMAPVSATYALRSQKTTRVLL